MEKSESFCSFLGCLGNIFYNFKIEIVYMSIRRKDSLRDNEGTIGILEREILVDSQFFRSYLKNIYNFLKLDEWSVFDK